MTNKTLITNTFNQTQKLGSQFADKLKNGGIIALYGDLGSGKTTFVQGLAKGLGIESKIISPTFIIVRKYEISKSLILNFKSFYHVDLYRIANEKDIESLGLAEIINDPENIIAIEWPEKIEKFLPKKRINLHFQYLGDNKRQIEVNKIQ